MNGLEKKYIFYKNFGLFFIMRKNGRIYEDSESAKKIIKTES